MKKTKQSAGEDTIKAKIVDTAIDMFQYKDTEDAMDSDLDIKAKSMQIHTNYLKESATSDLVLAYLDKEQDRKTMYELYNAADYILSSMMTMLNKYDDYFKFNPKAEEVLMNRIGMKWTSTIDTEKTIRMQCKDIIFQTTRLFVGRLNFLSLIHRNKTGNFLIKALLTNMEEKAEEQQDETTKADLKALKKQFANQEKQEE